MNSQHNRIVGHYNHIVVREMGSHFSHMVQRAVFMQATAACDATGACLPELRLTTSEFQFAIYRTLLKSASNEPQDVTDTEVFQWGRDAIQELIGQRRTEVARVLVRDINARADAQAALDGVAHDVTPTPPGM